MILWLVVELSAILPKSSAKYYGRGDTVQSIISGLPSPGFVLSGKFVIVSMIAFKRLASLLVDVLIWRACFWLLMLVLAYLSFKPNPEIQGTIAMPTNLGAWFDLHDDWKNLVGFGAMGFAGFMAWPTGLGLGMRLRLWQRKVLLVVALCLVILFMELVQIPIPRRWFDVKDLVAGSLGVGLSWPLAAWIQCIARTLQSSGQSQSHQG
jgi:hypothetical protein